MLLSAILADGLISHCSVLAAAKAICSFVICCCALDEYGFSRRGVVNLVDSPDIGGRVTSVFVPLMASKLSSRSCGFLSSVPLGSSCSGPVVLSAGIFVDVLTFSSKLPETCKAGILSINSSCKYASGISASGVQLTLPGGWTSVEDEGCVRTFEFRIRVILNRFTFPLCPDEAGGLGVIISGPRPALLYPCEQYGCDDGGYGTLCSCGELAKPFVTENGEYGDTPFGGTCLSWYRDWLRIGRGWFPTYGPT